MGFRKNLSIKFSFLDIVGPTTHHDHWSGCVDKSANRAFADDYYQSL